MGEQALTGLKVIDLTRVLGGPYCTQILGDHGADIIKIEPPQGDETRAWGPPFAEHAAGGAAAYFIGVNRNKRGMALDLSKPAGRAVLLRLLEDADILTENYKTGTLEKWGIGYEALAERFPKLIHCRVSGFGADGPLGGYAGYDAVVQAVAGLMSVNGEPDGAPIRLGVPVVDLATGLNAAIGILLALVERGRSGRGQFVESSLYDSAIALQHPHLANYLMSGRNPARTGNAHPNIAPYDLFETKTKPIYVAVGNDRQFERFCEKIGAAALREDARFASNGARVTHRADLRAALAPYLTALDGAQLAFDLLKEGVPAGPVQTVPEMVAHPHTAHRQMVAEIGDYRGMGTPVKLSRTPGGARFAPPAFGEATRDILTEHGYSDAEIDALIADQIVFTAPPA